MNIYEVYSSENKYCGHVHAEEGNPPTHLIADMVPEHDNATVCETDDQGIQWRTWKCLGPEAVLIDGDMPTELR